MRQSNMKDVETLPVGRLAIIPLESCASLGSKVNHWISQWRHERESEHKSTIAFEGYERDSYIVGCSAPRFGSGEAKAMIDESVRGDDIYIMVDVCNYSISYRLGKYTNLMSPDDHFQDLKRVIAAISGKARRINVIMPYLYEGRQSKRSGRESIDCALALQELVNMGVENILTFDAHDDRVQNSTPLHGFETIRTAYQFIKALIHTVPDIKVDSDHLMVISPDEGGMNRAVYMANVLGVDMGMFYKRRDYSVNLENGRHPVVADEFLGADVAGKDMIIVDDMISSGDTMLEIAAMLKQKNAGRIFMFSTFGIFTNGLEKFDKAYEKGLFDYLFTTNLIYQRPDLLEKPYYVSCDMSKYIALLIDALNHDMSISSLLNPVDRINTFLEKFRNGEVE
ncbi:MAG: ribose-phosphate pyrophosphokinase [Lachnospiraceae bacterium]|nr:ribose-phosphate pyrophosphokinase [Lachnospiraceae bacterium]MDY4770712.1 ribose-phosphate pyrophosphokinase [Lachnospiraceae bacterium]